MTKMMMSWSMALLLSCATVGCADDGQQEKSLAEKASPDPSSPLKGQDRVNADAKVLQEFKERIDRYMELHNKMEHYGPRMKETSDPAKIKASQEALAKNLRMARKDAKAGDIFTPETRQLFRRLMYPELKGSEGPETKDAIKEETPAGVALKVNARYPDDEPLPTVPPNILASLPKLPEELEYRIVKKDLILLDTHANLIVDFIPNAIR